MLKRISLAAVAVVLALAAFVATRPASYRVERTVSVAAPPAAVWPLVSDFRRWAEWSPWEKLDPAMRKEYAGTPGAAGASYRWVGNDKVGEGRMTLVEAAPGQSAGIRLEFLKPFAAVARSDIRIDQEGAGSRISWSMSGTKDFAAKAFSLFTDMDAMIGKDYEAGLAALKRVVEAAR